MTASPRGGGGGGSTNSNGSDTSREVETAPEEPDPPAGNPDDEAFVSRAIAIFEAEEIRSEDLPGRR